MTDADAAEIVSRIVAADLANTLGLRVETLSDGTTVIVTVAPDAAAFGEATPFCSTCKGVGGHPADQDHKCPSCGKWWTCPHGMPSKGACAECHTFATPHVVEGSR